MPVITAYQCPRTKKVFTDKSDYMIHLRALAAYNIQNRKEATAKRHLHTLFIEMRQVKSLDELEKWIIDHSFIFFVNGKIHGTWFGKYPDGRYKFGKITSVNISIREYKETCSNSHQAPIGKVQNWEREVDKPIGYPGWYGRIKIWLEDYKDFNFDLFKKTGINTGTGGGGEYDVFLFKEDWPGLADTAMRAKLAGGSSMNIRTTI
jgi:uncharacterized C2H2 Zn-finger protein